MAITPPGLQSKLSMPIMSNNFIAMQSAVLTIGTGSLSTSITFTNIPSTQRVTYKLSNTGSNSIYVASGNGSATAVVSSSVPQPTMGTPAVSNCDCIPAGAILTQDYVGGSDTIAAICKPAQGSTLEISIGGGQ